MDAPLQRHNSIAQSPGAKFPLSGVAFLSITLAISLFWSHYKLMWQDEILALQTDGVSSLAQLVHVQRTSPVSIDPLAYHVLAHFAIRLFGSGAFAIRLPALIGFLLMQVCLYFFVRRIANERTAVFALAFPALTATLYYSAEGRPYGLLLGFCALAMVSWQTASRLESKRLLALVSLALAVTLTLNTHYYGILFLVPLCAAEAFRTIERGKLDFQVIAAIGSGIAGIAFTVPFMKATGEFRLHNYNTGHFSWRSITQAYRSFFVDYTQASLRMQSFFALVFLLLGVLFIWGCVRQLRSRSVKLEKSEAIFLFVLAALPLLGYLMARFVTHSIESRHVIPAFVGITPLLAFALSPLFRRDRFARIALIVLFIAIASGGTLRVLSERTSMQKAMSALIITPQMKAVLMAIPGQMLYLQDLGQFETAAYYEPDGEVRARMALVYSIHQEMLWSHHDNVGLIAMHLQNFTNLNIVPYESLSALHGNRLFVQFEPGGWDWTRQAFAADHADVKPVGTAFGGEIVSVHFIP